MRNSKSSRHPGLSRPEFRTWKLWTAFLVSVLILLCSGCAKIGDPQPPEVRITAPASDLAVRQLSESILLTFSKPERNTNGTEAETPKSVEVYRLAEASDAKSAADMQQVEFLEKALRLFSIPSANFTEHLKGNVFVIQDNLAGVPEFYTHGFRYAVLFVNAKNQSAGLSNQAVIRPVPIPVSPTGLSARVGQNSISLNWVAPSENIDGSRPPNVAGYNIYRAEGTDKMPSSPLNPDPVQTPSFQDTHFSFAATYRYAVSAVTDSKAEGPATSAIPVEAKDTFTPEPAGDFNAILQENVVVLFWVSSSSPDVAGYRIYRKEKGGTDRRALSADLIHGFSYRDTTADPGKEYEYEIQAEDNYGNQSLPAKAMAEKP